MVEEELKEILTEYKNIVEAEHSSFVAALLKNSNVPSLIFSSLQYFEDGVKNVEILNPLCDLLLNIYRRDPEYKYFTLQFLPHLAFIYLVNYGDKEHYRSIEAFLISIHNIESHQTLSFRIPGLGQNSIYHEAHQINESRVNSLPEVPSDKMGYVTVEKLPPPQVDKLNSQNKMAVIAYLFSIYCNVLTELNRTSVEYTCKLASRMVTRGFSIGTRKHHRRNLSYGSDPGVRSPRILPNRLCLSSAVLLELLQLGFFSMFNQIFNAGLTLIRDIEFRGKHASMDSVLLVSRALLKMAPNGPSVDEKRYISTPSQLSKNIITNASFRTKKLEMDIPRVEPEDEGGKEDGGGGGAGGGVKMGVIVEEEEAQGQDNKKHKDDENIASKIKARMEHVHIPVIRKKNRDRLSESEVADKGKTNDKKDKKREKEKKEEKDRDKDKEKDRKEGKNSMEPEGVEELRMHALSPEIIAIHSPESGSTSIF